MSDQQVTEMLGDESEYTNSTAKKFRNLHAVCSKRAAELDGANEVPLHHKVRTLNGARVYSALAALLYATLSLTRIEDLERFIVKRGSALPSVMFDMKEWGPIIAQARQYRNAQLGRAGVDEQLLRDLYTKYTNLRAAQTELRAESSEDLQRSNETLAEMISVFQEKVREIAAHAQDNESMESILKEQLQSKEDYIQQLELDLTCEKSKRAAAELSVSQLQGTFDAKVNESSSLAQLQEEINSKSIKIAQLEADLAGASKDSIALRVELDASIRRCFELQKILSETTSDDKDKSLRFDAIFLEMKNKADADIEIERANTGLGGYAGGREKNLLKSFGS